MRSSSLAWTAAALCFCAALSVTTASAEEAAKPALKQAVADDLDGCDPASEAPPVETAETPQAEAAEAGAAEADAAAAEESFEALDTGATRTDYDPWEGMNRDLFAFHESIDRALLEPTARGYRAVTPNPVREGVGRFLRNLRGPQIFANDVLQGEVSRAGVTAGRFAINTTIGLLGIFDPASHMGLEPHTEDFGQTLGVWGVPAGPYIFVPLLGPTNVRDGVGAIVNLALDPLNYAQFDGDTEFMIVRTGMSALAARESVIDAVDNVRESSIDPYVTIRSTYGILRESAIRNGLQDVQDLPDFDAIDDQPETSETSGVEALEFGADAPTYGEPALTSSDAAGAGESLAVQAPQS
ncbi:MAG: VacJ family lipoprotein [Hyphomonadaceae bacterium]